MIYQINGRVGTRSIMPEDYDPEDVLDGTHQDAKKARSTYDEGGKVNKGSYRELRESSYL